MKLSVERKPDSLVVLDITADDDEFSTAVDNEIRKTARKIQVPGFRKGKAPAARVEKIYGREAFVQDASEQLIDKLYQDALKQEDLTPVGRPDLEVTSFEPLQFQVSVPVYPEAVVGDYSTIRVEPVDAATSDADVDEVVERLQRVQSPWVDVEEARSPEDAEQVTLDYEVFEGEDVFQAPMKNVNWVLGETNLLPGLTSRLKELKVGEPAEFDLEFAEDDETADGSIRGKTLRYKVELKGIKQRDLVEVNDEFAKKVAGADTVEALRKEIFDDVHNGKTTDGRTQVLNDAIEQLVAVTELPLPHAMIHEEAHHRLEHLKQEVERTGTPFAAYLRMQNKTEEDLAHELEPEAETRLRSSITLSAFAKAEGIEVGDDELDAEVAKIIGPDPDPDDKEAVESHARMKRAYGGNVFRDMLKNQVFNQKVQDRLIEIATEGKGAVLNAYVAPVAEPEAAAEEILTETADESAESVSEATPTEEAADKAE